MAVTEASEQPGEYRLVIVDLFCGGGGFSTGMVEAVIDQYTPEISQTMGVDPDEITSRHSQVQEWLAENIKLVAVNHWDPAVETFRENHPWADVHNSMVQSLHPPDAVDGHDVDILIAGPSCVPHSRAKGGMADDDQKRMGPRHVAHWLELLRPDQFLLENVPGFVDWGPLDYSGDEPKMIKDGSLFEDWIRTLRTLGYTVDYDTFVAADYGDPQSRKRLFVMGRLNYEPVWPVPTHSAGGGSGTQPYRTAADIIDWSDRGMSIWTRDRDHPRVHNTLKYKTMHRIAEGVRRHCDDRFEPFADALEGIGRVEASDDVDEDDYLDIVEMREDVVPVEEVESAVEQRDEPFLVRGQAPAVATDGGEPTSDDRLGLCVPYLLGQHGGSVARDATERPVPTVTTGGHISVIEPEALVLPRNQRARDEFSNPCYEPDERPLHTVTAKNNDGHLVSPYLVEYYGQSDCADVEDPLPTVTTRDRHALIVPEAFPWGLDLRFRMLQPPELKLAQGFPDDYTLCADAKKRKTKLIGNAVPVGMARSLCETLLEPTAKPTLNNYAEGPKPAADREGIADD